MAPNEGIEIKANRCKYRVPQPYGRVRPCGAPHADSKDTALFDIGSEDAIAFELDPLQNGNSRGDVSGSDPRITSLCIPPYGVVGNGREL
jgi:hypothetical protein